MAGSSGCGFLWGWNAIAKYLGVSARTVQRWRQIGLPVSHLNGRVKARPEELRLWVEMSNDME